MLLQQLTIDNQFLDGRYRVNQLLATGGVGQTYLAEDTKRPGNPVCVVKKLKYHSPEVLEKTRELFAREGNILEKLGNHPQIPRLLAYFEENGKFYLVQEYIEGKTLAQELEFQQVLSETQVINLLSQLLEILDFIHGQGVIHRDIKPTNIICRSKDHKLVLIDFGAVKEISTLENQETIIYTEGYAPTEQCQGQPSICSDIYAVGMIGIQALTGIHPGLDSCDGGFKRNHRNEIIWQNFTTVNKKLTNILTKMVRQNKLKRYQSVREVQRDLQQLKKTLRYLDGTVQLPKRVSFWQKFTIPLFLAIDIVIVGVMLILLAANNSEPFVSMPELSLQGQAIQGNLHDHSQIDPIKNTYYAVCVFEGRKNQQVTIEMNSDEFDPILSILKPNGELIRINDDISPQNFNSRIVFNPPEDGKYQLIAQASQPGERGNYQLKASAH